MLSKDQDCLVEELDSVAKLMRILRSNNKKLIVAVTSYIDVMYDVAICQGNVVSFQVSKPTKKEKLLLLVITLSRLLELAFRDRQA